MANTFIKLSTVTVGASGSSTIDFTSIPQTFTDLKIVLSHRTNAAAVEDSAKITFNNSTAGYSYRYVYGTGSATASSSGTADTQTYITGNGNTSTASVFSNAELYIPNYTSSNFKSASSDSVSETNATAASQYMFAHLWSNTAAITSIKLAPNTGTLFVQYTTATLYGIKSS